jgi:hypothetical protein
LGWDQRQLFQPVPEHDKPDSGIARTITATVEYPLCTLQPEPQTVKDVHQLAIALAGMHCQSRDIQSNNGELGNAADYSWGQSILTIVAQFHIKPVPALKQEGTYDFSFLINDAQSAVYLGLWKLKKIKGPVCHRIVTIK